MSAVDVVIFVAGIAMVLYALLGGADFGAGVWSLLATGPRAAAQRDAVSAAIGPVWEAHHVWLIYLIVLSFTCFPAAYADVTVGLYLPMSIALLGIVLRGASFVFRTFTTGANRIARDLSATFGVASLVAPFALGDCIGALATGHYAALSPFALSIGVFAVAVCAQSASVLILVEISEKALRDDFRKRAIRSTIAVWLTGLIPLLLAKHAVYGFSQIGDAIAISAIVVGLAAGLAIMVCILAHRDSAARIFVALQSAAIFGGWYGSQAPDLIPGRYTVTQAAASDAMIFAFLGATLGGFIILIPSLWLLFSLFKSRRALRVGPPGEVR